MTDFSTALRHCNRKIVIHETCFYDGQQIVNSLQSNDILFFDDCLYSQYGFLMNNAEKLKNDKNVTCVMGFSTSIFRRSDQTPIQFAHCAEFHDKVHSGDESAYAAYMSIDEVKQLLEFSNVALACHGDQHLELSKIESQLSRATMFKKDIGIATDKLSKLNMTTDIFVYPYAFDQILLAHKTVRSLGYKHIFAGYDSQRLSFEDLSLE